jgi:maleate isomerase
VETVIRVGVLTPHEVPGPEVEFAAMAPGRLATRVVRITGAAEAGGSGGPVSPAALRALTTAPWLDRAAEQLLAGPVDAIGYASTTSAYTIGFDAEMAMVVRLSQLTGSPVAATCASAVVALRVLQVERVALVGAPFAREFNELGAAYFASQGFDVVSSVSAGLSRDPRAVEPAAVCEWVSRQVADAAQAVFIGGNGFRAAGAVEALEAAIGRLVLTSNQVLLWQLLAQADDTCEINGYGRLFAHRI